MFVSEIRATNESDAEGSLSITGALTWPDGENWWEVRLWLVWLSACLTNSGWYKADVDTGALQTGEREACVERTSLKSAINSCGGIYSDADPLLHFSPADIWFYLVRSHAGVLSCCRQNWDVQLQVLSGRMHRLSSSQKLWEDLRWWVTESGFWMICRSESAWKLKRVEFNELRR